MKCGKCLHYTPIESKFTTVKHGKCNCDKFTESSFEHMNEDGLDYWDHDNYHAGFYVGENFGCIHFKTKES